jgi:D-alanine-D-alanine ligase
VAVIRGGRSLERDISLRSGHHVGAAARRLGHEVTEVDLDAEVTKSLAEADVVFIALHGRDGEDGTIQLVCEALGVAYTGSSPLTCRFAFDKGLAKGLLHQAQLPTPPAFVIPRDAVRHMGAGVALRQAAARIGYPLVVKPAAQGSALGLAVVEDAAELTTAALGAFDHGDRILLERFMEGVDVSVAVRGPDLETLPGVEIRTRAKVFDFETRVSPGSYEFVCPSRLADDATLGTAIATAKLVGVRDFGRVDMRVTDDGPTVLDVKTCPGLTESSIVPFAVDAAGLSFDDFVGQILDAALARAPRVA